MLSRLKALFSGRSEAPSPRPGDVRFAVAALLVEAARSDETYDDRERSLIDRALTADFGLDRAAAAALRARAEAAQAEAHDLHRFTKIAKSMAFEDKVKLVESLWRVVLSDGARDPFEEAVIRRVCGLIYVSDVESGAARKRIETALQTRGA